MAFLWPDRDCIRDRAACAVRGHGQIHMLSRTVSWFCRDGMHVHSYNYQNVEQVAVQSGSINEPAALCDLIMSINEILLMHMSTTSNYRTSGRAYAPVSRADLQLRTFETCPSDCGCRCPAIARRDGIPVRSWTHLAERRVHSGDQKSCTPSTHGSISTCTEHI